MNYISIIIKQLNGFFFKSEERSSDFLSFFRVAIALICLGHCFAIWKDFLCLYGNDGVVPAELVGLFKITWIPSFGQLAHYFAGTFDISESTLASLFKTLYVCACLALACGWTTPLSALAVLSLHLILTKGSPLYAYGVDYFKTIALFYCITFSIGNWFLRNPTPFRRILQLHLSIVYFFSGFEKLLGYNWHNGEAIWKALHLPYLSTGIARQVDVLGYYPFLFIFAGWTVILVELGYPVFMCSSTTRKIWLIIIIIMHSGIALSLGLYFFSALMIILNLVAFDRHLLLRPFVFLKANPHGCIE